MSAILMLCAIFLRRYCSTSFAKLTLNSLLPLSIIQLPFPLLSDIIGPAEGGIILTDDEWLYIRFQSYRDAVVCWRPSRFAK